MSTDTRARAAKLLGLAPGATREDATGAFLAGLPAADFAPPGWAVGAVNTLAGTGLPPAHDEDEASGIWADVEAFCQSFWTLAPADRRAEFVALGTRTGETPATARLRALEPGLDVAADPLPDPDAEEVAAVTRELFVLGPRAKAIRRNEWLLANAGRHTALIQAASHIREHYPDLPPLEPTLYARLTLRFAVGAFASAAAAVVAEPAPEPARAHTPGGTYAVETEDPPSPAYEPPAPPPVSRSAYRPTPKPASSGEGGFPTQLVYFILIGVYVLSKILSATSSSGSKGYQYTPPPAYQSPDYPTYTPQGQDRPLPIVLTRDRLESFKRYKATGQGFAPPHYFEWIAAGSPEKGVIYPTGR